MLPLNALRRQARLLSSPAVPTTTRSGIMFSAICLFFAISRLFYKILSLMCAKSTVLIIGDFKLQPCNPITSRISERS